MLRAVAGVLLALAVLGAAWPATEAARVEHAHGRVHEELAGVRDAVRDILARDDPGGRRVVTVALPERSWASAGVERVALGARGDRLAWRVAGGRDASLRVPVAVRSPSGRPLVLRRAGRHRLVLALVGPEADPSVVVRRTFKADEATTPGHAGIVRPGGRGGGGVSVPAGVRG